MHRCLVHIPVLIKLIFLSAVSTALRTAIAIPNKSMQMSRSTISRGAFIVFEGVDRCGKSTQCKMLADALKARMPCEAIRFPDRTSTIGTLINSYLASATNMNDQTIHLLFSANRWEASEQLHRNLEEGTTLICDRYAFSGVAFSSAKGLDIDWCMGCDRNLPAPDAVIYLDISPEEAALRGQYGEERYEKIDFQHQVRNKFMELKERDEQQDEEKRIPWHVVDSRQSIEELHKQIECIASSVVDQIKDRPINKLWPK